MGAPAATAYLIDGEPWEQNFDLATTDFRLTYDASAVPLPPAALLMGAGLAGFGLVARRRKG